VTTTRRQRAPSTTEEVRFLAMPTESPTDEPLIYDRIIGDDGMSPSLRIIRDLVPVGSRVLDVGCASGYFSEVLARDRGCQVVGLDYSAEAVEVARKRGIEAHVIDLDRDALDATGYDVVIFADVLEHVRDPGSVLESARGAASALVSLPNIANWTARRQFLAGRFPLEDFGLFDRTHLRFFTRRSSEELLTTSGWTVTGRHLVPGPVPLQGRVRGARRLAGPAARALPELFAWQFINEARPASFSP
jgi:methionine biosynthesis protein MetW